MQRLRSVLAKSGPPLLTVGAVLLLCAALVSLTADQPWTNSPPAEREAPADSVLELGQAILDDQPPPGAPFDELQVIVYKVTEEAFQGLGTVSLPPSANWSRVPETATCATRVDPSSDRG